MFPRVLPTSFLPPSCIPLLPLLSCCSSSHQVELLQVVSEDGVFDGHEDEADVFRVCGAGKVRVQCLVLVRVLFLVHFQDEFLSCCCILLRSCKSGSIIFQHVYGKCNLFIVCIVCLSLFSELKNYERPNVRNKGCWFKEYLFIASFHKLFFVLDLPETTKN